MSGSTRQPRAPDWTEAEEAQLRAMMPDHRMVDIARAAARDGVKGRWDRPPTGNAMRRVWGRVCAEQEERKAKER